nr:hypothetical protein [Tanacetum cinerariifolium]
MKAKKTSYKEAAERVLHFNIKEPGWMKVWKQIHDFIPIGSKEEAERFKRKGIRFEQESVKKLKTSKEVKATKEVPEEKVKEMMQLVPVEEIYVEALQVKHPIIDWKVHIEGQRSYWKIARLEGSSASYQFFVDMLKHLDRNLMHAPVEWKLYDTCGVHHVTSKDKEISMLEEKDYPLRKGQAIDMNKMHKAFPLPVIEFLLPGEDPTASEESSHWQKKRDAPAEKIALLLKSSSNCQSKSYDSYAKLVLYV